jgi:hypothetical protein
VIGPLTARQLAILAVTGLLLYTAWSATRLLVPVPVFLVLAVAVGTSAAVLALGQRDGVSLDRLLLAAVRQRMQPRHQVPAPDGIQPPPDWLIARTTTNGRRGGSAAGAVSQWERVSPAVLRLPARAVTDAGVIDLGADGLAAVAVASTVNFALRTPGEQESLVASFGRYLHSLTAPVQVLIRAERLDLTGQIIELRERAGGLPHPALEAAALEHAEFLVHLGEQSELLRRQVLLVLREPLGVTAAPDGLGGPSPWVVLGSLARGARRTRGRDPVNAAAKRAAQARLARRLREAIELLSPVGIVLTVLDAGQATAVLAAACNPDTLLPASAGLAGAEDVITAADPDPTDREEPEPCHGDRPENGGPGQGTAQDGEGWEYGDGLDGGGRSR